MRRIALALIVLAAPAAISPAIAQSPAQRQAQQELERDQRRDRVTDVARDLEAGGARSTAGVVDDMNRERPTVAPTSRDAETSTPRVRAGTTLPLLSDNPQR
jgi:hypothetical protein